MKQDQTSSSQTVTDPITLQVMASAFYSIADEIVAALVRTSYSTNIKDRRDCSGGVFDRDGDLISQGEIGTPLHLGVMLPAVKTALAAFPPDQLQPGDDIILNTPYPEGPGHLNDVTLVSPVYYEGELVGYVANMSHHVDVGGFAPGSMPFGVWEHYQEGVQIPPLKIVEQNRIRKDLIRLITQNVRTPVEFRGDLVAQIAANNLGEKRIAELVRKHGKETVYRSGKEIMDYSERRIRAAISKLPRASGQFEDFIEGDGLTRENIGIRATVRVEGSEIVADFSDSDPQALGPINCRPPSVRACVYYVVKALLDPGLPPNSGAYRPLKIITRAGTLLEAEHPHPVCNANIITTQRIVDVLLGAFLDIIPDRVPAGCSGTMNLINIGGTDVRTKHLFNYVETYGGGQGALLNRDGMSGVQNHMTNTRNAPVEVIEATYPLKIRQYGLVEESAGAGKYRGGYGMQREFEILTDRVTFSLSSDRFELCPWGIFGGEAGRPGSCTVLRADGGRDSLPSKVTHVVHRGDRLLSVTPGGGGRGNPLDRRPEKVMEDVRNELLSIRAAREVYGVVLNTEEEIDLEATGRLRSEKRSRQEPPARVRRQPIPR